MDRDELLNMLCVDQGAPIPDDVVEAGWTLILVYRDVTAWERASALARSAGLPVIEEMSRPPQWLDRAATEELGYADFLRGLLEEELAGRDAAATARRLREAAFPFAATIEQFDFRFRPELKHQVVLRYLDPSFVERAGTLTLIGSPGLGKTMLAVCVATKQV